MSFGFPRLRLANVDQKVAERASIWSAYFHRFCDPREGFSETPVSVRPVSRARAIRTLATGPADKRPTTLKRCVGHIAATDFDPAAEDRAIYYRLARRAAGYDKTPGVDDVKVLQLLRAVSQGRPFVPALPRRVSIGDETILIGGTHAVPLPTRITMTSTNEATVVVRTALPRSVADVGLVVSPENWAELGPFFEETVSERRKTQLREVFVCDWNMVRFERFEVLLNVDHTKTPQLMRTDYSLNHETDGKLSVDDGYVEARRIEDTDWTLYTACKTVRFAVGYLNVLAPAVICMFLESNGDWLLNGIAKVKGAKANTKTRRKRPAAR